MKWHLPCFILIFLCHVYFLKPGVLNLHRVYRVSWLSYLGVTGNINKDISHVYDVGEIWKGDCYFVGILVHGCQIIKFFKEMPEVQILM